MKILKVVHNFPPEFRGGVERVVETTARALLQLGHEILIVAGSERRSADSREETIFEGLRVIRLLRGERPLASFDLSDQGLGQVFDDLLLRERPDLVHVHHWWNLSDDLVRRAALLGFKTAVTLHDFFASCPTFFRLQPGEILCDAAPAEAPCGTCAQARLGLPAALSSFIASRHAAFAAELSAADLILAPSRRHAEDAGRHFEGVRSRIAVLPLPVRAFEGSSSIHERRAGEPLRVLHFGHLSRLKGVEVLVRAVRAARERGANLSLLLVGKALEADLDLEGAEHRPHFDREDLPNLAADCDLAVFPSLARESYGLVVDEALAVGLPVVVGDRGALSERVMGKGLVVPSGDVLALTEALCALAQDPKRVYEMRRAEGNQPLSPEDHAQRLLSLYSGLAKSPLAARAISDPLALKLGATRDLLMDLWVRGAKATSDETVESTSVGPKNRVELTVAREDIDSTGELISVITRTRNRKASLREAIASVAAQTHKAVEHIIVNDGGEDVLDVVRPFMDRLQIKVLNPGRVRRCRAANLALGAARGTWIAWLDDDDLYDPNHLEVLVRELKRGPHKVVYSGARCQELARQEDGSFRITRESVPYSLEFSRLELLKQAYIHLVMVGHHRECFERLGGFDETIEVLEDHDMFIRYAQDYEFRRIPGETATFRIRDDGTNAVQALREEFVLTRSVLFQRYGHMAMPEIFAFLEEGRTAISGVHARLAALEARLDRALNKESP